jgi:hypothetical protein
LPLSPAGSRHSQRGFITRSREMNAWLYRRSWTEADLETVGPLPERTEDVTIAITPRRWRAWDIRSTFFVALQEAGIALDDAET